MNIYLQYGNYLTELLQALINGKKANPPKFEIDWEKFYNFCSRHKIGNMVYLMIKDFNTSKEILDKFYDDYKKISVREAKQELYSKIIYEEFEKAQVSFMPVKGILIKKLYPVENYRGSNDIDILIKDGDFKKAQNVLTSLGFKGNEETNEDNDYHIEYHKNMVSIEIHSSLTPKNSLQYDYFKSAFDRAKKLPNSDYHYKMTDEDFYVYVLYHLYKHFIKGGVGVRYFLDMYLINSKMTFNQDYLKTELKKIGLLDFDATVRELGEVFFNNKKPDERLTTLSQFVYISGAHGEKNFFAMAQFSGAGTDNNNYLFNKIKYFKNAWFIGRKGMSDKYPVLNKHPYLLPFCYIHKGFYTLFCKPKAIKTQVSDIKNLNKDSCSYIDKINHLAGL